MYGNNRWSCTIFGYYHIQGTVQGWEYWAAASFVAQFQARRLNIKSKEDIGIAPWFQPTETETTDQTGYIMIVLLVCFVIIFMTMDTGKKKREEVRKGRKWMKKGRREKKGKKQVGETTLKKIKTKIQRK